MASIDYFISSYGTVPWLNIDLTWEGTATTWTLYRVDQGTALYTGTEKSYAFTGTPGQRYDFRLEATDGDGTVVSVITVFTRTMPAPVGLSANSVSDTAAILSWSTVAGVDKYEVADVTDGYSILDDPTTTFLAVSGLTPRTRQSYAVRSVLSGVPSRWSAPVTFTTTAPDTVVAGVYSFPVVSSYVWGAGLPGSSDPGWRPVADDWYHGEGYVWGDISGAQTTYFFYGDPSPFGFLDGGTVTKVEVYLSRAGYGGDPAAVLSRWNLHNHVTKPVSDPSLLGSSQDAGSLSRGQSAWVELPTSWGDSLIDGTARGVAWGGVAERYQVAANLDTDPRHGDLRITVI